MFMHRWQTFLQYIASTRLLSKGDDSEGQGDLAQAADDIVGELQKPETEKKDDQKGGLAERRQTIAALTSYHKKVGGQSGEEINLEKQFKEKLSKMANFDNPDDPMLRRLSIRRGTLHELANRRQSLVDHQRRSSSFAVGSSFSSSNNSHLNRGYEEDSVIDDDEFSGSR